jgi:acetyl-CoA acetyltransferase
MKERELKEAAGLRPVFEAGGSNCGNSSQMSDGARLYL